MRQSPLRTRITTGAFSLPIVAAITLLLWFLEGFGRLEVWGGIALTALTAYGLVEVSNRNALLRVRSRMVTCSFLTFMSACSFLHDAGVQLVPAFCWVAMCFCLFGSYGRSRCEGLVFYAFLSLSVGSLFSPLLLLCAPLLCFSMIQQLRVLTWRTFVTSVLGLLLPYWFIVGYAVWTQRTHEVFSHLSSHFAWVSPDYGVLHTNQVASAVVVVVLSIAAIVHYIYTAYNDKIRIRMFYYLLIIQQLVLSIALLLRPQDFDALFVVLLVNSSPLVAHHLTLARGRWADVWMWFSLSLLLLLTMLNNFDLWRVL